jgi:hypothetical protein
LDITAQLIIIFEDELFMNQLKVLHNTNLYGSALLPHVLQFFDKISVSHQVRTSDMAFSLIIAEKLNLLVRSK